MKKVLLLSLLTTALGSLSLVAQKAQANEEEVKIIQEEDKVVFKKETALDFSDVMLSGELIKPNAAYVKNRRKTKFPTLIEHRSNFRAEMMETLDKL